MLLNKNMIVPLFLLLLVSSIFIPSIIFHDGSVAEASDDWYIVVIIVGRGPKTSAPFRISESQYRIEYSYITSTPSLAKFELYVYRKSEPLSIDYVSETGVSKSGVRDIPTGHDDFYVHVEAYKIDSWDVTVLQQGIVEGIPRVEYTPVATFNGTGDKTTPLFTIDTDHFLMSWKYDTFDPNQVPYYGGEFLVQTFPEGETENPINILMDSGSSRNDTEYIYTGYNKFYGKIDTAHIESWTLTILKPTILLPSNITCFVLGDLSFHPSLNITTILVFNGTNQIMGHLSDSIGLTLANRRVTLTVTMPDNSSYTIVRFTNEEGMFYYELNPSNAGSLGYGSWSVQASWDGDEEFDGATSEMIAFTVGKLQSTLSCSIPNSDYRPGDIVKVTGILNPPISGKTIWVIQTLPEGEIDTFTTFAETGADGTITVYDTASYLGSYSFQVSWDGDENFEGATSQIVSYTVRNVSTLSCSVDRSDYQSGDVIAVEGFIDPSFVSRAIDLIYTMPNGTQFTRTVASGSLGSYIDEYPVSVPGNYTLQAHWVGNDRYTPASSKTRSFTVTMQQSPFWMQWWFWLILTSMFVGLGGIFFLRRR